MSMNTSTYADLLVMVSALKEENETLRARVAELDGENTRLRARLAVICDLYIGLQLEVGEALAGMTTKEPANEG